MSSIFSKLPSFLLFRASTVYEDHLDFTYTPTVKKKGQRVPFVAQQLTNLTRIHEDAGSMLGLAQWVKDPVLL